MKTFLFLGFDLRHGFSIKGFLASKGNLKLIRACKFTRRRICCCKGSSTVTEKSEHKGASKEVEQQPKSRSGSMVQAGNRGDKMLKNKL